MTGRVIGHYRILDRIGAGGMGVVYSAEDTRLQRRVALKFPPAELCRDAAACERLFAEARAASALDHPNICTIHAIEELPSGEFFIVMAEYGGETLKARLENGALPVDDALSIAEQVARGLSRAHGAGIVHRDVKPANIMLTSSGVVKILDFGLAVDPGMTMAGGEGVWGTLAYMSPEQAGGEPIDAGADIWALGAILYEMLAGRPPFEADSARGVLSAIMRARPLPLAELRGDAPRDVLSVVARALAPERAARYARVDDMLADIGAARKRSGSGAAAAARRIPSVAVLPFSDMSAGKDQDWFCEGVAEELINALAALENLRVVARTSSFQFKGQSLDVRAIGEKLDVNTVLEGSVRKAGNRLRITAQLIDVASGFHLFSERYDRDMDDVFAVQDEIARTVVGKLRVRLTGGEAAEPLVQRHTAKPEAYQKYLEGRYYWTRRHDGALLSAIASFKDAIAEDPDYALAHAGLADAFSVLAVLGLAAPLAVGPLALASAERAIGLDAGLSEAHAARALIQWTLQRDWDGALASYDRALALNTHANIARGQLGSLLAYLGRPAEAVTACETAARAEPLSPVVSFYYAGALYNGGDFVRAVAECDRALRFAPDAPLSFWIKAMSLAGLRRFDEALPVAHRFCDLLPGAILPRGTLGMTLALAGETSRAGEVAAELEALRTTEYVQASSIADIYCGLRDADSTIAWLERAFGERDGLLPRVFLQYPYYWLHDDPRFFALFRKMNLGDTYPNPRG